MYPHPPALPVGVTDAIYLDNLIFKLQVQVECAIERERERKRGGELANAHGLTHTATPMPPLPPSFCCRHCSSLKPFRTAARCLESNQTIRHINKRHQKTEKSERNKRQLNEDIVRHMEPREKGWAWQRHWWDEVSIFSQVSSADFHFHRMQLNASFAPLFFLFFFLCLLSVAATKVSQTTLKCIYKCKNERGAAAQRSAVIARRLEVGKV